MLRFSVLSALAARLLPSLRLSWPWGRAAHSVTARGIVRGALEPAFGPSPLASDAGHCEQSRSLRTVKFRQDPERASLEKLESL